MGPQYLTHCWCRSVCICLKYKNQQYCKQETKIKTTLLKNVAVMRRNLEILVVTSLMVKLMLEQFIPGILL